MDSPATITPIACDMTTASDTPEQRMQEYRQLFAQSFAGRERTADGGVRLRLHAHDGVEAWVRDLAAREKACCAFFDFAVSPVGDEVHWDATVVDDDIARLILDEFYDMPYRAADGVAALNARLGSHGLRFLQNPSGTVTEVRHAGDEGDVSRVPEAAARRQA
jgi:hypothetical protein